MATRRVHATSDDSLQDSTLPPSGATEKSQIAPAVPASTIIKLAIFTVAMFVGPLSAYFLSLRTIFAGNATYAGALAAAVANIVLIAYVVVALWEDQGDQLDSRKKTKKAE